MCLTQMMPKENSKKTPVKSPPWVLAAGVGTKSEIPNEMGTGFTVNYRMLTWRRLGLFCSSRRWPREVEVPVLRASGPLQ